MTYPLHGLTQNLEPIPIGSCVVRMLCVLFCTVPLCAFSEEPTQELLPPPRTIEVPLKPAPQKRVAELYFFDEMGRLCIDSYKLESGRTHVYTDHAVTFRAGVQRKCDNKTVQAPRPEAVTFSVRNTKSKKATPDATRTEQPQANTTSFSHTFSAPGTYQVTVVHKMNDVETHTVSFFISVSDYVPPVFAPQIAD